MAMPPYPPPVLRVVDYQVAEDSAAPGLRSDPLRPEPRRAAPTLPPRLELPKANTCDHGKPPGECPFSSCEHHA